MGVPYVIIVMTLLNLEATIPSAEAEDPEFHWGREPKYDEDRPFLSWPLNQQLNRNSLLLEYQRIVWSLNPSGIPIFCSIYLVNLVKSMLV